MANTANLTDRKYDAFIFDLDGTLLNTLPDLVLLTNGILEEEGYPTRTEAEILSFVGNGVRRLMYQALPANIPEEAVDRAMELWNERFHEYYHNTHPYSGVVEMLQQLRERGCKIGVVSNKLQPGVDVILDICVPGLIDIAYGEGGQDSHGRTMSRKPDPIGLFMAMDELGATPEETLYVGDSAGDMRVAHNAGVSVVAVSWGYQDPNDFPEDAQPDVVIDSPAELLEFAV